MQTTDTAQISAALGVDFQPYDGPQARYTELAYIATGPRGAQYGLVRYPKTPQHMFVMNLRTWNMHAAIAGNGTFTDADGTLRTVNA